MGNPRFCELLYLWGPGSSGKDTVMMIFLKFFGEDPHNYGVVLNGDFLVGSKGGNKEGASPFLSATQGKRLLWASEVPKHESLQLDLVKQYCEQAGAPISARKLYKGPVTFRAMGGVVTTSNYPPNLEKAHDDGFERRLRVWESKARFTQNPTTLTEVKSDDTLKERIMRGDFNSEVLWWVLGLAATLTEEVNPGTVLLPRPACMLDAEAVVKPEKDPKQSLLGFLGECKPVEREAGTKFEVLRDVAATALRVSKAEAGSLLTQAGVSRKFCKAGFNVAVWKHPSWKKEGAEPALQLPSTSSS